MKTNIEILDEATSLVFGPRTFKAMCEQYLHSEGEQVSFHSICRVAEIAMQKYHKENKLPKPEWQMEVFKKIKMIIPAFDMQPYPIEVGDNLGRKGPVVHSIVWDYVEVAKEGGEARFKACYKGYDEKMDLIFQYWADSVNVIYET